ncbi:hypothetical protein [uncultured Psychrobacter sp.]|uniref:hypothetical protein n=1 Tax=uncultured Psychrobacter sp. TaxID=259303 RepID=UPI0034582C5B
MKKLLTSSILALSSVFALTACTSVDANTDTQPPTTQMQKQYQGKMHKGSMKDGRMRGPFAQLNLTATQQAQIQAIKQNNSGDRMQKREAIMQVLTAEQRNELARLKVERQAKRKSHGKEMKKGKYQDQGQHINQNQSLLQN